MAGTHAAGGQHGGKIAERIVQGAAVADVVQMKFPERFAAVAGGNAAVAFRRGRGAGVFQWLIYSNHTLKRKVGS